MSFYALIKDTETCFSIVSVDGDAFAFKSVYPSALSAWTLNSLFTKMSKEKSLDGFFLQHHFDGDPVTDRDYGMLLDLIVAHSNLWSNLFLDCDCDCHIRYLFVSEDSFDVLDTFLFGGDLYEI